MHTRTQKTTIWLRQLEKFLLLANLRSSRTPKKQEILCRLIQPNRGQKRPKPQSNVPWFCERYYGKKISWSSWLRNRVQRISCFITNFDWSRMRVSRWFWGKETNIFCIKTKVTNLFNEYEGELKRLLLECVNFVFEVNNYFLTTGDRKSCARHKRNLFRNKLFFIPE